MQIDRFGTFVSYPAFLTPYRAKYALLRTLLFVAVFTPLIFVVSPPAVRVGAYFGALIDTQILGRNSLGFALLYKGRLTNFVTWGSDLGVVAAALPQFIAFLALIATFVLLLKLIYRRPLRTWITAAAGFRWRLFWTGLILFELIYAGGLAVQGALTPGGYKPALGWLRGQPENIAIFIAAMLVIVSIQAAAEELLCRSWMQKELAAHVPNIYVVLAVSSAIFSALHMDSNPYALTERFVGGLALGWAVMRTNGLEFGIGLHSAWNLALQLVNQNRSVNIPMLPGVVPKMPDIPMSAAEWAVLIALPFFAFLLVELVVRWRPLRLLLRVDVLAAISSRSCRG